MKSVFNVLILTPALVAGASQAQAEAVWHFPYKGAPYATQSEAGQPPTVRQSRRHTARHAPHRAKAACKTNIIC